MRNLLYICILAGVLAFPSLTFSEGETSFNIGAILALSGDAATLGNAVRRGIELAYSELTKEEKKRYKLFIEDDGWQRSKTLSAFNKLVSVNKVKAVLVLGSGSGNTLCPLAERKKVVLIAVGASDPRFVKGKKYCFTHWVPPKQETDLMVKEIKRKGYKSVVLVASQQEGIYAFVTAFKKSLAGAGLENTLRKEVYVLPGTTDFRTIITAFKSKSPDAIVSILLPGSLGIFALQVREQGIKADFVGAESFESREEVRNSRGALLNQWYVNGGMGTREFRKKYFSRWRKEPGWASCNGYDSLKLVVEGTGKSFSVDTLAQFLFTVSNFRGGCGVYSATGDNRFSLPAELRIVKKDGFYPLYSKK